MLIDENVRYNELVKLTDNGIDIANYVQIRDAFTKRYKEIYGQDIDLSTGSADGQYVEMHSLIINNILETIKQTYASLDANQAQGHFLDIICALSNVTRKNATKSVASIAVKNTGDTDITLASGTQFIDKNGNTWTYKGDAITLATGATQYNSIVVECDEIGPVSAPGDEVSGNGWITTTVESTTIDVKQYSDADMGSYQETDTQLRARRNASLSMGGFTVLESLQGALLSVLGIEDVKIYNNATDIAMTTKITGQTVNAHSIYVIVRQRSDIAISDKQIGQIIYEKLTPGINTTEATSNNHSYTIQLTDILSQTVNWRQAQPIGSTDNKIVVELTKNAAFSNSSLTIIAKRLKEYLNNLAIGEDVYTALLFSEITNADPLFRGQPTYVCGNITIHIDNADYTTSYTNSDKYFNFTGSYSIYAETDTTITIHFK